MTVLIVMLAVAALLLEAPSWQARPEREQPEVS